MAIYRSKRRSFFRQLHGIVVLIEPWSIFLVSCALLLSVAQFWLEFQDRIDERVMRSWTLISTAAPGNSGIRGALEYLNRKDGLFCFNWKQERCAIVLKHPTEFVGIDLSSERFGKEGAYLKKARLRGVNIRDANLKNTNLELARLAEADLRGANLSHANLKRVGLADADLEEAKLNHADLRYSRLEGANLRKADLSMATLMEVDLDETEWEGATLTGAIMENISLRGADLRGAIGLVKKQLDGACGDKDTTLPNGWKVKPCR